MTITEVLQEAADLLTKELEKENPYEFKARVIGRTIELQNYVGTHFSVAIDTLDKVENHLNVHIKVYKYIRKVVPLKVKKLEYPLFQKYYEVICNMLVKIAEVENKEGIIICYDTGKMDEKLANFLKTSVNDFSTEQYDEETLNLIEVKNSLKIAGMKLSEDLCERTKTFAKVVPKLREIIECNSLLTLENVSNNYFLNLFDKEIVVRYAGERLEWSLTTNHEILSKGIEDESEKTLKLDKEAILEYLENLKEEKKLRILIKKPMDNYMQLIRTLGEVGPLAKASKTRRYWASDSSIELGFEKLEECFGSWENVEHTCVSLLDEWRNGTYNSNDASASQNTNEPVTVFTYEFSLNDLYIYFTFVNKGVDKNDYRDELHVMISKERNPMELKMLTYDMLTYKR